MPSPPEIRVREERGEKGGREEGGRKEGGREKWREVRGWEEKREREKGGMEGIKESKEIVNNKTLNALFAHYTSHYTSGGGGGEGGKEGGEGGRRRREAEVGRTYLHALFACYTNPNICHLDHADIIGTISHCKGHLMQVHLH